MNPILSKIIQIVFFILGFLGIAVILRNRWKKENRELSIFSIEIVFVGVLVSFLITKGLAILLKIFFK